MILPPWVKPAIAAVALAAAFSSGWTVNGWRWEAKQADALRVQQAAFQRQLAQQNREAIEYEREREAARQESRVRETEIRTIYKDRLVPAECEPPADAVRVLNNAIERANARAGGEPSG